MKIALRFLLVLLSFAALGTAQTQSVAGSSPDLPASIAVVDTPYFYIPVTVNEQNYHSWDLCFGISPSATKGIDPARGEKEYPPFGPAGVPGAFLFIEALGYPISGIVGNAVLDLRPFTSTLQSDTFIVRFQPDGDIGYPFVFSWPSLGSYYSGAVNLRYDVSGSVIDVNMKTENSYILTDTTIKRLYIIAQRPKLIVKVPNVVTVGLTDSLSSLVYPKNVLTTVWFEYGTTTLYGTSTTVDSVTGPVGVNAATPFDPSLLPNNTRYHIRATTHNSFGTYHGNDQIFSRGFPPPDSSWFYGDHGGHPSYRTFRPDSISLDKDNKGKVGKYVKRKADKVLFSFSLPPAQQQVVVTVKLPMLSTGLMLQEHGADTTWTVLDTLANFVATKMFTSTMHVDTGKTIQVIGVGSKGSIFKSVEYIYNTLPKVTKGKVTTFTQRLGLPMPNRINALYEVFGGLTGGLTVGVNKSSPDSSKLYGWFNTTKYGNFYKSLVDKSGMQINPPHPFDTYVSGKPVLKLNKSLPPTKYNSRLFADLAVLKFNIAASAMSILPLGFGELLYNGDASEPWDGMMVKELAAYADTLMMGHEIPIDTIRGKVIYSHQFDSLGLFIRLDSVISLINTTFEGPMDTVSFANWLVYKGVRTVSHLGFLRENPGAIPARIIPGTIVPQNDNPLAYRLEQNFPNPFNPTTTIQFALPEQVFVTLKVYNILGQEVATLFDREMMEEGTRQAQFNASSLASGVYFYRLVAERISDEETGTLEKAFTRIHKMLLIK